MSEVGSFCVHFRVSCKTCVVSSRMLTDVGPLTRSNYANLKLKAADGFFLLLCRFWRRSPIELILVVCLVRLRVLEQVLGWLRLFHEN